MPRCTTLSQLKEKEVINVCDGRRLGQVCDLEFDTDSTECWIDLECDYSIREMYLRVELDGFLIQRFMIPKGRNKFCLYRDMLVGELKEFDHIGHIRDGSIAVLVHHQPPVHLERDLKDRQGKELVIGHSLHQEGRITLCRILFLKGQFHGQAFLPESGIDHI